MLVLDGSENAIRSGGTAASAIQRLETIGVQLYSNADPYAKVFAFDNSVIIGSANLSESARYSLIEYAILSRDSVAIRSTKGWIDRLARQSVRIDSAYIDWALSIPVESPSATAEEELQPDPGNLWYLARPPNAASGNTRAYFLAMIIAQLGGIVPEQPFLMWPNADFGRHLQEGRMHQDGTQYELTATEADYFKTSPRPDAELIERFLSAIRAGIGESLPAGIERRMFPLQR